MTTHAIEGAELAILVLILFGYPFVITSYRRNNETFGLFLAYTALLVGSFTPIAEALAYNSLTLIEHTVGLLGTSLLLLHYSRSNNLHITEIKERVNSIAGGGE